MDALKNRKFTVVAVMFLLIAAQENSAFAAYLKQIGPSRLRFSLVAAFPESFILPQSLIERQKPTNTTEIAVSPGNSAQTNAVVPASIANPAHPIESAVPSTEPPVKPTPTPSASDLLPVSPQMLTEFFKPVGDATNSAGTIEVPVPVGFTPPSAPPSSRATYNSP